MIKNFTKFKIHPVKGQKPFYTVYIFDDNATMRLFSAQIFNGGKVERFQAVTHSYFANKKVKGVEVPSDTLGSILFHKSNLGHGIVTHELAHAMNYFLVRQKVNFNVGGEVDDNWKEWDEVYAMCLGYMNNQFWKKCGVKPGKERY